MVQERALMYVKFPEHYLWISHLLLFPSPKHIFPLFHLVMLPALIKSYPCPHAAEIFHYTVTILSHTNRALIEL